MTIARMISTVIDHEVFLGDPRIGWGACWYAAADMTLRANDLLSVGIA
jgi:hypothetical protein